MEEEYIAGVDIGGTWIRAAICTKDLKEDNIKKKSTKTLKETKLSISNSVCEILSDLIEEKFVEKYADQAYEFLFFRRADIRAAPDLNPQPTKYPEKKKCVMDVVAVK